MRIAIVTTGGVGGYFGGLLARSGENVAGPVRGAHLAAIKADGLRVEGPLGDFTVRLDARDDATQLGIADVAVFAVKLFHVEAASRATIPLFGPETIGPSLLNGIGGPETITRVLPGAAARRIRLCLGSDRRPRAPALRGSDVVNRVRRAGRRCGRTRQSGALCGTLATCRFRYGNDK